MESFEGINKFIKVTADLYGETVIDKDDIILRHQADQYDHVRVHETDDMAELMIRLYFYSQDTLQVLANEGVAEAFLDEPTPSTVRTYNSDLITRMELEFEDGEG